MMAPGKLRITLVSKDRELEQRWAIELGVCIRGFSDLEVTTSAQYPENDSLQAYGQVVFVDGACAPQVLQRLDRKGRAIFLVVKENGDVPVEWIKGDVDDVLVHPFRRVEVLGKVRQYSQILMWDEVQTINASFKDLLSRLHEDLALAERLQKGLLPTRFPDIKGMKVAHRYLAGIKPGGDYFDLAESRDQQQITFVMTDSSSYGLSSQFLSVLMKVAVKLSAQEARSGKEVLRKIHEEIQLVQKEKDRLSIFYGILSRKDYRLRYMSLGSVSGWVQRKDKSLERLLGSPEPVSRDRPFPDDVIEGEIQLRPEDRFVLVSDGFVEATQGAQGFESLLQNAKFSEAKDLANELVFRVKKEFKEADDMAPQDCTVGIFDIDSKILRLA